MCKGQCKQRAVSAKSESEITPGSSSSIHIQIIIYMGK